MTKLLDQALEMARDLSPDVQDDIARIVLQLAGADTPVFALSQSERTAVEESKAAAARGEFATSEEVQAVWARHGL